MVGEFTIPADHELSLVIFIAWARLHTVPALDPNGVVDTVSKLQVLVKTYRFSVKIGAKMFGTAVLRDVEEVLYGMGDITPVVGVLRSGNGARDVKLQLLVAWKVLCYRWERGDVELYEEVLEAMPVNVVAAAARYWRDTNPRG